MESLQQSKLYQKEQKRQFKELKELVRRHQKKTSELLREINNKYKKMARQCSKSRYKSRSLHLQNMGRLNVLFWIYERFKMESSELICLLMCFSWHRHQKLRFKQWERRAPATAERRAAAAAPGSEAGAVLQSEISTERTHQNGKNQEERQTPHYFSQISLLVGGCFFWRHET